MRLPSIIHLALTLAVGTLPLRAQTTITYTDGQNDSESLTTTAVAPLTLSVNIGEAATQSGVISGDGDLGKVGEGRLTLSSANTYTGGTVLNAGTLGLGADNALGSGTLTINGGTLRAEGAGRTLANDVILNGNFTLGRYTNLSGAVTLGDDITIISANPDTSPRANSTISGIISGAHSLTFDEGANPIGDIILAGVNTYSGATTIQSGTVWIADTGSIASSNSVDIAAGATLKVFGFEQTINNLSGAGSLVFGNQAITLTVNSDRDTTFSGSITNYGSIWTQGAGILTLTGNSSYTGGTVIDGGGGLIIRDGGSMSAVFAQISASTVTVTGAGSTWAYSEEISLADFASANDSILTISDGGLVRASTLILGEYYGSTGTLNIGGGATAPSATAGVLDTATITTGANGAGTVQFNTTAAVAAPFYFTRDGTASGNGIIVSGNATVINTAGFNVLRVGNSYTGGTIINGGTLAARGGFTGLSSLGTGPVTVNTGGTLAGNDLISGLTTVHTGGTLAPDVGGILLFSSGLILENSSILTCSLGSQINALLVTGGALTGPAGGKIIVNLSDSGGFTAGTYNFIDATGATLTGIDSTSFELGSVIAGYDFSFAQSGNLFQLIAVATAIPEPSTYAGILGALTFALAICRRRFRSRPSRE